MNIYTPYPNKKTMASRKARKSDRNKVFQANKSAHKRKKKGS